MSKIADQLRDPWVRSSINIASVIGEAADLLDEAEKALAHARGYIIEAINRSDDGSQKHTDATADYQAATTTLARIRGEQS